MGSNAIQLLLTGKYSSGRGVRMRMIDPAEKDRAANNAAQMMGKEATGIEYSAAIERQILLTSIMAVTRQGSLDKESVMTAEWEPMDFSKLELAGSEFEYSRLFTAKDDSLLIAISRRMHGVTSEEVDALMGEAIPISDS